eukprot:1117896-Rhodomonas_salina.1
MAKEGYPPSYGGCLRSFTRKLRLPHSASPSHFRRPRREISKAHWCMISSSRVQLLGDTGHPSEDCSSVPRPS